MVDASARGLPAGALAGSSADLGDFDECLSVLAPRTRFCVARLLLPHRHSSPILGDLLQQPITALLTSNILYVETFFFVGAFLLSHHVLQQFSNNVAVNPIHGLLLRYIRLTPAYLVVVGAHASVLRWVGSGPLWGAHAGRERLRCRASWWANALYINNYVHTDQLCMFQSWYLAVDTQLFAVSLLLLTALGRRRTARRVTLVTLLMLSCGVSLIDALLRRYDATVIMRPAEAEDLPSAASFTHTYIKTHLRATTYLCGLLFGDVCHHYFQSGIKISKRNLWACWALAMSAGAAAVFSVLVFYWPFRAAGALDRALYSGLVRLAWSACVGWVIFACATRHADAVLRLLSWSPLVPLGRLSYCAYLVNGLIGLHSMGEQRTPLQVDAYTLGREVLSSIVLTYISALLLSLMIDSPMQALQGVITGKGRKKKEELGDTKA